MEPFGPHTMAHLKALALGCRESGIWGILRDWAEEHGCLVVVDGDRVYAPVVVHEKRHYMSNGQRYTTRGRLVYWFDDRWVTVAPLAEYREAGSPEHLWIRS